MTKSAVRQTLATKIRTYRKVAGFTQVNLGKASRLSGKFIGEVERGEKSISIDSLYRVCRALAVPMAGLVRGLR